MLDREHPPGPAHARLHFVDDEQHAVGAGQLAQPLQELVGRDDVAAFALNRLDEDRGDFVRRHQMEEDFVLEVVETLGRAALRLQTERTAVAVRERRVEHARRHRPEPAALDRLARRQRERAERAAVKRAEKRDDVGALGGVARQLDARLDRFGAGVAEKRSHAAVDRRDRRQLLGQLHLRLVIEIGARHVEEALRLLGHGADHVGMRVPRRRDGDAGRAVEEHVAVDILHDGARAARHHERVRPRVYDGETTARSRSMSALAFGPGRSVLMDGTVTFVSSACQPGRLRAARRVPPGRPECGRRRRSRGGGGRRDAPRSGARSPRPAPAAARPRRAAG